MTITLAEVIEQCAQACDKRARRNYPWGSENSDVYHAQADWAAQCARDVRALAAQYEGCIVCELPARMSIPSLFVLTLLGWRSARVTLR